MELLLTYLNGTGGWYKYEDNKVWYRSDKTFCQSFFSFFLLVTCLWIFRVRQQTVSCWITNRSSEWYCIESPVQVFNLVVPYMSPTSLFNCRECRPHPRSTGFVAVWCEVINWGTHFQSFPLQRNVWFEFVFTCKFLLTALFSQSHVSTSTAVWEL